MTKLNEREKPAGRGRWVLAAVDLLLVLAAAACAVGFFLVTSDPEITAAAERFKGESDARFAQIACYLPVGQGKEETDIFAFRSALESRFVEESLQAPENGSLYLDAYCGRSEVTVSADQGNASVAAYGVGGDFFHFHPLRLRSGAYIAERDLMDDLVVLDESLAWRLYGGMDLTGLTVYINGHPFVVAGVVAMEDDPASKLANTSEGALFMSFSALKKLREDVTVDCYEIVLPDPITGYASSVIRESFPLGDGDMVENSGRWTLPSLWRVIGSFGERSMRTNAVVYPYWENALRLREDYAALLLVLAVLFALCPAVTVLVLVIRGICRGGRYVKTAVPEKVEAAVERRREQQFEAELEKREEM